LSPFLPAYRVLIMACNRFRFLLESTAHVKRIRPRPGKVSGEMFMEKTSFPLKSCKRQLIVAAGILLWCALQIFSMIRTSATVDEPSHIHFGTQILAGVVDKASMQKMPVSALNALALFAAGNSANLTEGRNLLMARLPSLFMGVMVIALVVLWSRNLFGWRGAMVSFCAAIFCPNLAAHSALATNDISCALGMLAALWGISNFIRDKSYTALLIAALTTGIAQLTKNTALLLVPIGFCAILAANISGNSPEYKRNIIKRVNKIIVQTVLFFAVIILCINTGYGFHKSMMPIGLYLDILPGQAIKSLARHFSGILVPLPYVFIDTVITGFRFNQFGTGHGPIYLFGRLSSMGFWYYFPVIFLLKVPITLIVFSACACAGIVKRGHHPGIFLMICAAAIFLFFTIGCSAQIGFRYLLPVMPLLFVMMGIIPDMCDRYGLWGRRFLLAALCWLAVSTMSYYPHWLSYMNEFVPFRTNAYLYCADSNLDWEQSRWYLNRYLEKHPQAQVEPPHPVHGEVIISANSLVGIVTPPDKYLWLRTNYRPVDNIAYSYLVFYIP
jgi:hypothetical protein